MSKHRKTFVRKSGGLGIFIKNEILPYVEIVDVDSEFLMVLKIKNNICTRNEDSNIILAFVYLPPEGSDYSSNDSMTEIERELLPIIENNKYFYFMGDCNARTGTSPEFNIFDINQHTADQLGIDDDVINYLNNTHELNNHDIPQFRNSMDKVKNNFGNKLLELCKNNNLYICNGRFENDSTCAFTCTRGSVIDYLISNIDGFIMLNSFIVHKFSPLLSDVHCAISFTCKILLNRQQASEVQDKHKKWEQSKKAEFVNNVNRQKVNELNVQLKTLKRSQCTKIQLENIVTCVKKLFVNSAKISFKGRPVVSKKIKHSMPWFGLQCRKAQRKYYLAKRNNLTQRNEASKRKLTKSCKKYKSTVKNYHQKYIKKE